MPSRPCEPAFDLGASLLDPAIAECPYGAYEVLQGAAPVWWDPGTGMYVVTAYDDVRTVLLDTMTFSSRIQDRPRHESPAAVERSRRVKELYAQRGWVPAATLAGRDDPEHKQMRALFDRAFRPAKIRQLDPFIENVAHRLIDDFIDDGRCDWVSQFAVALPLIVIGKQMGADQEDIWRIKAWTDAWVQRLGMMQSDDEALWSTEMEIEAQHYFQPIFERLREHPDDTLLSEIVNTEVPQWGRKLTDEELHAEMMADTFVGGAETSTNALSAGMMLLVERPGLWDRLKADPSQLPVFIEEVLRLEAPVQGFVPGHDEGRGAGGCHDPGRSHGERPLRGRQPRSRLL
jgi:cytochrome P450